MYLNLHVNVYGRGRSATYGDVQKSKFWMSGIEYKNKIRITLKSVIYIYTKSFTTEKIISFEFKHFIYYISTIWERHILFLTFKNLSERPYLFMRYPLILIIIWVFIRIIWRSRKCKCTPQTSRTFL